MKNDKIKYFITATVPAAFVYFRGFLHYLNNSFDVCAISSELQKLERVGNKEHVRTHYVYMERSISVVKDFISLLKLIIFFIKERPDIVHGNTPKASFLSIVAAWITRVPVRIYMCHGLRYQCLHGALRKVLMLMEKITCALSTEVICVSYGLRQTLISDRICKPKKAVVLGCGSANGTDFDYFSAKHKDSFNDVRKELTIPQDAFVFIYVGRIVEDKGINELVHAFYQLQSENPSCYLLLLGIREGKLNKIQGDTSRIIQSCPAIFEVGFKEDIRPYLFASDAFVFPSYREGLGMVLIEAAAMGVPCIASDIMGCDEVIIKGENGELIPKKDKSALYIKMKDWINHPEKVKQMSLSARKTVETRYSTKIVWKLLHNEFIRLIQLKKVKLK